MTVSIGEVCGGDWAAKPPNAEPRASQQSWQESHNYLLHKKFTVGGW